jgi:transposase
MSPIGSFKKVFDGIMYVLRTGCQWKMLLSCKYESGFTRHKRFQAWVELDIFRKIWIVLLEIYDNKKGIKRDWQYLLDSISIKSPLVRGSIDYRK